MKIFMAAHNMLMKHPIILVWNFGKFILGPKMEFELNQIEFSNLFICSARKCLWQFFIKYILELPGQIGYSRTIGFAYLSFAFGLWFLGFGFVSF